MFFTPVLDKKRQVLGAWELSGDRGEFLLVAGRERFMHGEDWTAAILEDLRKRDLERVLCAYPAVGARVEFEGRSFLNFSSNNYLDLSHHPEMVRCATEVLCSLGTAAGASRLVTGTLDIHQQLEREFADFKGNEAALVFGSGYLANLGVLSALAGRNDVIIADRLAHATIIDGAVLSRARLRRFQHNDLSHLEELLKREQSSRKHNARVFVVTESVFSMDGDLAPLKEIVRLCFTYEAMPIVDEAHAIGVFGENGSGLLKELGLEKEVNLCTGTFSKALGSYGGFVTCSKTLRHFLVNRARPFIFNTSLPPSVIAASIQALKILTSEPQMGGRLLELSSVLRARFSEAGLDTLASESQIIPVVVGSSKTALSFSRRLYEKGILAIAIRVPTVPEGTARIRFSVSLSHSREEVEQAAQLVIEAAKEEQLI